MKLKKMFSDLLIKWFNYHPIPISDVFTPTCAADLNYVDRPGLEGQVLNALGLPGKQLLLFGHSGSGKTTLIRRLLKKNNFNFIQIHCEKQTTYNDILFDAFDQLDKYVVSEKSVSNSSKITGNLVAEYKSIKAEMSSEHVEQAGEKLVRILPPRLTPQKLAAYCGEGSIMIVIEDFHKVEESEKKRIADLLKIFVDNANDYPVSQVICIGACENVTDLVKLEPNLKCRVDECKVPMLNDKMIAAIVSNGCQLLNVKMEDSLCDKIVFYSSRIGSQAHQMCYDICKAKGITERQRKTVFLHDADFQYAVNGFLKANEGTLSTVYESAVRNELGWYILKTFTRNIQNKLPFSQIRSIVNKSKKHFSDEEILGKLDELCSPEYGVLYYNSHSDKYYLSSPFWQAFLRMQFAYEDAEKRKAEKNKNNHNLRIDYVDKNGKTATVDLLLLEYLKMLEERYK